jgi:exopolysaccharide biosynthesis operon protein EpsL
MYVTLIKTILNQMLRVFFLSILLAILFQGVSLSAIAASGDTFSPYVFASMTHDSNLLRLSPSASNTSTADFMRQMGVGMNVDWKVARQQILLMAAINDSRFDRYSMLNYRGRDLQGHWKWQLDNHLSGNLGCTDNLTIGSFENQQVLVSNQRTQQRCFYDGRWLFHPSWQVGIGASKSKLSFSDIIQRTWNREDDVWETTLQYLSSATGKVGVKLRETNGHYPNQPVDFFSMLDNGYHLREILATVDWNYSGHSLLQGQAGTVQRKHDHFSSRDYHGINARGTYTWLPTVTVRLGVSALREITAYDDLTTSYSLNRGISLEPSWTATSNITVSGKIQHETHDFLGNPGILVLATTRKDTYDTRNLTVSYQPAQSFSFNVSVGDDKRDSNQPLFSFNSETVSIGATFQM